MERRGGDIDGKVKKLDEELLRYKTQMSKMKPCAAKTQLQQRALRVLKQKKMYEKQRDAVYNQQFNIDQTKFATESVKDTITTVAAMKTASKQLKTDMKAVKINEIEDLHDDMSDMLEDADEINEIMGRAYGVPEEVDEEDLMAELDAMEDELATEAEESKDEVPSYLVNAASAAKATATSKTEEKKDGVAVDEFGLPSVPERNLLGV